MLLESSAFTFQVSLPRPGPTNGTPESEVMAAACLCDPFSLAESHPRGTRRLLTAFLVSAAAMAVLELAATVQAGLDHSDGADGAGAAMAVLLVALLCTAAHLAYTLLTGRVYQRTCFTTMGFQALVSVAYTVGAGILAAVSLGVATGSYASSRGLVTAALVLQFLCFGASMLGNGFVGCGAVFFGAGRRFEYASRGGASKAVKRQERRNEQAQPTRAQH